MEAVTLTMCAHSWVRVMLREAAIVALIVLALLCAVVIAPIVWDEITRD